MSTSVNPDSDRCGQCGAALGGHGPEGLCAACLLESPLSKQPISGSSDGSPAPFISFQDYELLEEIARGGMGVVYRARQISLNRPVAIKMVLGGCLANAADLKRFRAEAGTTAQLQHPNIVAIHEVGEYAGQPFFSMDLIQGQNLAQVLRDGPLPARKAANYLKTIAEAVHYAHSEGVLHRDLKTSNILIDQSDQPRITDFGLAKRLSEPSLSSDALQLTRTGQLLGSPSFIPPEQAAGRKDAIGPASDVYSLGAILYHCLTARPPFVAETLAQILCLVAEQEPVSPRLLNPSVPRDLETICLKCLEKDPGRRYPTALALAEDVHRYLRNEPIHARPAGVVLKVHRWCLRNKPLAVSGTAILALLLVVAMGSSTAVLLINRERRRAEENAAAEERERRRAERLAEENRVNLYAARLKVAEQSFRDGDAERALQHLDSLQPQAGQIDLRSFDWYYLQQLCRSERLTLAHNKRVNAVAVSPDGTLVATAGEDALVRLWNVRDGSERARMAGHTGQVAAVTFAPDGTKLTSAGEDGTIRIWDVRGATLLKTMRMGTNSLTALTFSPDGALLASGEGLVATSFGNPVTRYLPSGKPGRLGIWDAKTFELLHTVEAHPGGVRTLTFTPDGSGLVSGGVDRTLRRIEVQTAMVTAKQTNFAAPVFGAAFSAGGDELVAASWFPYHETGELKILDGATLQEKRVLSANPGRVTSLAVSVDRKKIATAGVDNTARLRDFKTGEELLTFHGHTAAIFAVAFDPTGEWLVTAGWDGAVKLWDLNHNPAHQRIPTPQSYSLAFSPDGKLLACAATEVEFRESSSGKLIATFPEFKSFDLTIAFAPDGKHLVAGGYHGTVAVFDVLARRFLKSFTAHRDKIWRVAFSPDSRTFATGGGTEDPTVNVWDLATCSKVSTFTGHTGSVGGLVFSPNGREVISGTWTDAKLWNWSTGELHATLPGIALRLVVSADGRFLAHRAPYRRIQVRDMASLNKLSLLTGHKDEIYELAFSHDNLLLASASWDGTVKLWQVSSGQELLTISSRSGVVWSAAFSPDDRTLALGSGSNIKGSGLLTILRAARPAAEAKPAAWISTPVFHFAVTPRN